MSIKDLGKAINQKIKDYNSKAPERQAKADQATEDRLKRLRQEEQELKIRARIAKQKAKLEKLQPKDKGMFDFKI